MPRFSIHNVFDLKEEMDATDWGDILIKTAQDWAVPDVIENSETYKKLTAHTQKQVCVYVFCIGVEPPATGCWEEIEVACAAKGCLVSLVWDLQVAQPTHPQLKECLMSG